MDAAAKTDFKIGCILINEPTFFPDHDWVRVPDDWSGNIVQGKGYDLTAGEGQRLWLECLMRARSHEPHAFAGAGSELPIGERPLPELAGGYGAPTTIRPRLGQRSFRVAVLDSYGRRCAVTSERTLPALEAAHIREFAELPEHSLSNGILFRADIHKLFAGYVTVTPDLHFVVSPRIQEEFENGRDYYRLQGTEIRLPQNPAHYPSAEALSWHNEQRYLG
jgi:putative restriction endonuclease